MSASKLLLASTLILLTAAFLVVWLWRNERSALFWGAGYASWSANMLLPSFVGSEHTIAIAVLSQSLFLSSIFLLMHGLQVRVAEGHFAYTLRVSIWLATVACTAWLLLLPEAIWALFAARLSMRLALTSIALYVLWRHLDQLIDGVVFTAVVIKTLFIFCFAGLVIYSAWMSGDTFVTPQMLMASEVIGNTIAISFGITLLAAVAVSSMQKYRVAAMRDSLTDLPNRRQFDESLRSEWRSLAISQEPLSMLLIDVDVFKSYNDRYGHAAGDRCLIRIADVIRSNLRQQGEICARLGGEEFAVLLPATTLSKATGVAERLRRAVHFAGMPHQGGIFGVVTVSIGVATAFPKDDVNPSLFEAADAAMYRAKDGGRNRVETTAAVRRRRRRAT